MVLDPLDPCIRYRRNPRILHPRRNLLRIHLENGRIRQRPTRNAMVIRTLRNSHRKPMAILSLRIQDVDMKKGDRIYLKNLDLGRGEGTVTDIVDEEWVYVRWDDPGLDDEEIHQDNLYWII